MNQDTTVALYAPREEYERAANKLEHSIKEKLRPFQARATWARLIAVVITLIMGFLAFGILLTTFELALGLAILLAVIVQVMAVVAFHAWFYELHQGERQNKLKKWAGFTFALILSLFMLGTGAYRAYTYLSEMGMMPILLGLCILIFALIEPTGSCLAGFCTAGAEHALELPRDMMKRASEHRGAVVNTPDSITWQKSIAQAEDEKAAIKAENGETPQGIAWRTRRLKHMDDWLKQLDSYNPGRPVAQARGGENTTPPSSSTIPGLKMAD